MATTFGMDLSDLHTKEAHSRLTEEQAQIFLGGVAGFLGNKVTHPPAARVVAGVEMVRDKQNMATMVSAPPCDLLSSEPCYV